MVSENHRKPETYVLNHRHPHPFLFSPPSSFSAAEGICHWDLAHNLPTFAESSQLCQLSLGWRAPVDHVFSTTSTNQTLFWDILGVISWSDHIIWPPIWWIAELEPCLLVKSRAGQIPISAGQIQVFAAQIQYSSLFFWFLSWLFLIIFG